MESQTTKPCPTCLRLKAFCHRHRPTRRCYKCRDTKATDEFRIIRRTGVAALAMTCQDCRTPVKLTERKRLERMLNASRTRAKALKAVDDLTTAEIETLFRASDGVCPYCERLFDKQTLTLDHVVPFIAGGANNLFNLLLVCASCNARKKGLIVTGKELREIRTALGLTQQELANLLETSLNTISRWELETMAIRSPGAIRLALKYLQEQRRTKSKRKR